MEEGASKTKQGVSILGFKISDPQDVLTILLSAIIAKSTFDIAVDIYNAVMRK